MEKIHCLHSFPYPVRGAGLIGDINMLLSDKDVNMLQLIKLLIKDIDEWYKAKRKK